MKKIFCIFGLLPVCLLTSCSLLIKNEVNKKFPPVNTIEKKIQSVVNSNQTLLSTKEVDAEAELSNFVVDTSSRFELKRSNGEFVVANNILDSLKISRFKTEFKPQEATIESSQRIYLATATNKWISGVDFDVSASLSPYYSSDTIYFNPYFNRIHIHKVYFKKCAFLTKLKPLVSLVNSILSSYLDNINGQVKNYNVVVSYPQDKQIALSSILQKQPNVDIEKDGTIRWYKKDFTASVLIKDKEMDFLLGENTNARSISTRQDLSDHEKKKLFNALFESYQASFDSVRNTYFDSVKTDTGYLVKLDITNRFLQQTLNDGLANIDFRFKYPIGYAVNGIDQPIDLKKPNADCGCDGIVNSAFHCGGGIPGDLCKAARAAAMVACYAGSFTLPVISTYMNFCAAMKALPADFKWTIGEVKGNAQADCAVHTVLNNISFSGNLSQATIVKQLLVDGQINYDFNFSSFNKFNIGSTLFAILTQCPYLEMRGHPAVNGSIPNNFVVDVAKEQDNTKSYLDLTVEPFQATVSLNQSPGLAIVSDFKNFFSCNIGYSLIGKVFVMAHIVPDNVIPDKFRDYYDVFTQGRLDHTFSIKTFKVPLEFKTKTVLGDITSDVLWGTKSINSIAIFTPAK